MLGLTLTNMNLQLVTNHLIVKCECVKMNDDTIFEILKFFWKHNNLHCIVPLANLSVMIRRSASTSEPPYHYR